MIYAVIDTNVFVAAFLSRHDDSDQGAMLVTGNTRHYPRKPFVVTAAEFVDILFGHSGRRSGD